MAAAVLAAGSIIHAPVSAGVSDSTPFTCDSRTGQFHIYDAKDHVRRAYALKRWRRGPGKGHLQEVRSHQRCLERAKDRKPIRRYFDQRRDRFRMYREYRQITPYRCQAGLFGTWAIPCYVIACESGFSWSAYNPSGAAGPYQIMAMHGRPFPVNGFRDKLTHHRIAASLSLSAWVCA